MKLKCTCSLSNALLTQLYHWRDTAYSISPTMHVYTLLCSYAVRCYDTAVCMVHCVVAEGILCSSSGLHNCWHSPPRPPLTIAQRVHRHCSVPLLPLANHMSCTCTPRRWYVNMHVHVCMYALCLRHAQTMDILTDIACPLCNCLCVYVHACVGYVTLFTVIVIIDYYCSVCRCVCARAVNVTLH